MRAPIAVLLSFGLSCGEAEPDPPAVVWQCLAGPEAPEFLPQLGCQADFLALASEPVDATIPGARSLKTIIDRVDDNRLHFQNSTLFPIHWDYAQTHLSGMGLPVVPMLSSFNTTEYSSPSRRFLLGAVTFYESSGRFCYEISPYDTASAEMIADAYTRISQNSYFGGELYFHPTSVAIEAVAQNLPASVKIITTDQLFADVTYQPLNIAESYGRLRFVTAEALDTEYLSFRDIAVLEAVPNDISVLMGIITETFQTPLSHLNVLSKNRGTPNMALRGAFTDPDLRALEGKWVRLKVTALNYEIQEVPQAEADAWWEANKPAEVQVPGINLDAQALLSVDELLDLDAAPLADAVKVATRAYGGKAAHYSAIRKVPNLPVRPGFAIPIYYYRQFIQENGFDSQIAALLADPSFRDDPAIRDAQLSALRDAMEAAPVNPDFAALLEAKLLAEFPGLKMRYRSSTNAEDLDGFTGAGLYTSKTGSLTDPEYPLYDAIRKVWASIWTFRAFEERSYRSIDHLAVGMALLVHESFPDEEANGVALTNNPFDPSGLEPAFYINVQVGETSVVQPPPGTSTDEFLYYFDRTDQPVTFISRSNLVAPGQNVLTTAQTQALGQALHALRTYFAPAYARGAWWAMDVEFKFEGLPGEEPQLYVKQARPYQ